MLILQISTCAEAEGSQRPQRHTEHVMLKDAYVAAERQLAWQCSQEEVEHLGSNRLVEKWPGPYVWLCDAWPC